MSNPQSDSLTKKPADKEAVLVLFYNDLRIDDNATLAKAAILAEDNHRQLLPVYADALADGISQTHRDQAYDFDQIGDARQQFLSESLSDLDESLQRLGNRLLHLTPHTSSAALDTFTQLCQLIEQQQVTDIYVSQTADYNQNQAYGFLQRKYPQVRWHEQVTNTLFASLPMEALPKSFTQFRKQVESEHDLLNAKTDVVISPVPESLPPMPDNLINGTTDSHSLFFNKHHLDVQLHSEFKGGEANATGHLNNYFNSDAPSTYKTTRNALDDWTYSTKFSAWLANGTLSVNVLLNRLRHYEREVVANESTYWIWFELLWREYFYWYAMTHQQKLFWFKGIAQQSPTTGFDKGRLEQWKEGTTPYPIVNACMKQLKQTGYMSNRGRQIVASCFIHELGLDWRYGATHFEQYLIDYDVASNWGNWQYLAGVGADPRGCRQFNLAKQTQQYDPSGSFIHKWQGDNTDDYVLSSP
jgi:deoxyribodipyrimidine photo-lyase